jgi:hypothetical protein
MSKRKFSIQIISEGATSTTFKVAKGTQRLAAVDCEGTSDKKLSDDTGTPYLESIERSRGDNEPGPAPGGLARPALTDAFCVFVLRYSRQHMSVAQSTPYIRLLPALLPGMVTWCC